MQRYAVPILAFVSMLALGCAAVLQAQAPPILTANDAVHFDYPTTKLTSEGIHHFEVRWDGGAAVDIGKVQVGISTVDPLSTTFKSPAPPFTNGQHTAEIRACNTATLGESCDGWSSPFVFVRVDPPSQAPANLRKGAK